MNIKSKITSLALGLFLGASANAQQVVNHACWTGSVTPVFTPLTAPLALCTPYVFPTTGGVAISVNWKTAASYDIEATISSCINGKQESQKKDFTYYGIFDPQAVRLEIPFKDMCGKEKNWGQVTVRMYVRGTRTLAAYAIARADGQ